jgi:hypothetical protein
METLYSMEITLKGQPRILTIGVSEKSMVITLTDLKGNEIETVLQEKGKISIAQTKK